MISNKLAEARRYENDGVSCIPDGDRPSYHITGGIGWINDPNGFSLYRGEYHLFYQYHPYSNQWGPMHWGHMKSKDFIKWERLPIALAPDMPFDKDGCFSGSALERKDGKHLLMYTGVYKAGMEEYQVQCIAVGDGVSYEKHIGNPVIGCVDVPFNGNLAHFRDPKIWFDEEENCYYSVVANRALDESGVILLYRSSDAIHWSFVIQLAECKHEYGTMWECPDFFPLDGEQVLVVSPEEMRPKGLEFHAGNGNICFMGNYDKVNHRFERTRVQTIDYGLDFYAPQTMEAPDGRRIMIAWMQNWASCHSQPKNNKWFGQLTIPRELRIVNGRLIQNPVQELEKYRVSSVSHKNVVLSGEKTLEGIHGRVLDMTVTVRACERGYQKLKIQFAEGDGNSSFITYNPATGEVELDRSNSGFGYDIVHSRRFLVDAGEKIKIRILLDRFSAELFFNDGKQAASMTLYTPQNCDGVRFYVEGDALLDIEKYDLCI